MRTLQYYDEIGIFMPTEVTAAGYRLYDEQALETLQQILFFKELDFQLKDIKEIMENPNFDRMAAFRKQKKLLTAKRDRLNELLKLLDKLERGETHVSFKEFELAEYFQVLQEFKEANTEDIIKYWGSIKEFERFVEQMKDKDSTLTQMAKEQYGSIEKYVEAVKKSMSHFKETMEKVDEIKAGGLVQRNSRLMKQLASDITRDINDDEVQITIKELIKLSEETTTNVYYQMDLGENYWDMIINSYLHNTDMIKITDKQYGTGTAQFIGHALQCYFNKLD